MKLLKSKTLSTKDGENVGEKGYRFWDGSNYVSVLKRHEGCEKLASNMSSMFEELAKIESSHSIAINEWVNKYSKFIDLLEKDEDMRFVNFGTCKTALKDTIGAMKFHADSYVEVWSQIQAGCVFKFKEVDEKIFNKAVNNVPEIKTIREDMRTIHKPYSESLDAMRKARQNFVTYSLSLRPDYEFGDMFNDLDVKKRERWSKLLKRYEERKNQLSLILDHYEREMINSCNKCDEKYREFVITVKDAVNNLREAYSFQNNTNHSNSLAQLKTISDSVNVESDVKQWSTTFGPAVKFDHFQFENASKSKKSLTKQNTFTLSSKPSDASAPDQNEVVEDDSENEYAFETPTEGAQK